MISRQNDQLISQVNSINNFLIGIFAKPDDGEDPFITKAINLHADLTGQRVAQSLFAQQKAAVGGTIKGVNAALEGEATAAYPELAVANALQKALPKNPIAQAGLAILMQRMGSGPGAPAKRNGASRSPDQMNFNL